MNLLTERMIRTWTKKKILHDDDKAVQALFRERELQALTRNRGAFDERKRVMSFLTGTSGEVLYSSIATGTQLNTFTTEDSLMKTLPLCIIPAGFLYNTQGATGKCLRVKAIGRLGTTGTPTFTFTARFLTSSTWSAAGIGFSSAAITAGSGVTLAPFIMDLEIIFRTLGSGAGTTVAVIGEVRGGTSLAAGGGVYSIPAANTAFTAATFDNSVTNYFFLSIACGTSNASNLAQLEMMKVYGEN